ncbi:hypothetical protein PR048_015083, partial [Dryococelus australis]
MNVEMSATRTCFIAISSPSPQYDEELRPGLDFMRSVFLVDRSTPVTVQDFVQLLRQDRWNMARRDTLLKRPRLLRRESKNKSSVFPYVGSSRIPHLGEKKLRPFSYIDEEKNTAFSPMGYSALMAILAEGARGDTKTQLVNALHLPSEDHVTRAAYKHVLQNLKEKHQLNVPEFHTWFYVYKNFSIEPEFKSILLENYLTEVKNVEPLYEGIKAEPPTPELEAMMHLDYEADNDKIKHEEEDKVPEKQSTMSEDKHMMHEKEEKDSDNKDAKEVMTDEKKDMMPEKQEEMVEKDMMSDKKGQMSEKQDIKSHEDKMHEKGTEFVVTPEMIENKPDSIKDKFLEDLLNKELEDKRRKEAQETEEMKKKGEMKDGEIKDKSLSTSNKEGSIMMSGDDHKNDKIKREIMRFRRSVRYSSHDSVADKKHNEPMIEEKKESMMNEEDSFKEGTLMEESMLTHAMKEAAIIEEEMKDKKHHSSQEKEIKENPKKEMSFSEMQPTSEIDKKPAMGDMHMEIPGMDKTEKEKLSMSEMDKKPVMGDMHMEMPGMDKNEKEELSMSEKDKKKPDMKKEGLETMDTSKRITHGVLGNQDVTSGISGNSIVKKASERCRPKYGLIPDHSAPREGLAVIKGTPPVCTDGILVNLCFVKTFFPTPIALPVQAQERFLLGRQAHLGLPRLNVSSTPRSSETERVARRIKNGEGIGRDVQGIMGSRDQDGRTRTDVHKLTPVPRARDSNPRPLALGYTTTHSIGHLAIEVVLVVVGGRKLKDSWRVLSPDTVSGDTGPALSWRVSRGWVVPRLDHGFLWLGDVCGVLSRRENGRHCVFQVLLWYAEPGESVMIVFNALYYKGSWATAFNPQKRGQMDVFYTSAMEKVTVPIMHAEGIFNIASIPELDSTAVELPYQHAFQLVNAASVVLCAVQGDRYSLLVLLPNQRDGLRPLVADHLTKYPLKNIFKQLSPKQVQVFLPNFEVETTTNPKDALQMLGVMDVFSKEKANLSGISQESGLFVDELAQFVTIKVEPNHSETNYLT